MPAAKATDSGTTTQANFYTKHPFLTPAEEVRACLETNTETGLSKAKAAEYRTKFGDNKLTGDGGVKWYTVLGKQLANAMILVSSYKHLIIR